MHMHVHMHQVGGAAARDAREAGWLWRPSQPAAWVTYFGSLLEAQGGAVPSSGAWLALSLKGRSVASGLGRPSFDELIGTKLPPLKPPRAGEAAIARTVEESGVLDAQVATNPHPQPSALPSEPAHIRTWRPSSPSHVHVHVHVHV